MTIDSRLVHPNGEATAAYLHSVVLDCGLGESLATRVATNLAAQFDILAKGEPIAFEDVQVGDTIHAVREVDDMTERCVGVVSKTLGHTLYHQPKNPGPTYPLAHNTTEATTELYLLHRPKPAGALARLAPGIVRSKDGREWVFDGDSASRPHDLGHEIVGRGDLSKKFEPWGQVATLDYSVEAEPATTPPEPVKWGVQDPDGQRISIGRDLNGVMHLGVGLTHATLTDKMATELIDAITAVVSGSPAPRAEYGIRYGDGEVTLRPTAYEAVEGAKKLNRLRGPNHTVEPVTRISWGSAESAWVVIEVVTNPPTSGPVKYGMRDAHNERITVGRTIDGAMHIGVGGTYAVLTDSMAADLSKALTDVAAGQA